MTCVAEVNRWKRACGEKATHFDARREGMVCQAHKPVVDEEPMRVLCHDCNGAGCAQCLSGFFTL